VSIAFSIKQGRTFNRPAQYLDDSGMPASLENVLLTCQCKNFKGFEETMRIIVTDAASGQYRLIAPNGTLQPPYAEILECRKMADAV